MKLLTALSTRGTILMKATLIGLTLAISLTAGGAWAADPDDLQKLKDTGECIGCNLMIANLNGANLISANLSGANLRFAYLINADLKSTDLSGADLFEANLWDANLYGANLSGAIMNGAILCNTTMPDGSVIYSGC